MVGMAKRWRNAGLVVGLWTLPVVYWSVQAYINGVRFNRPVPLASAFAAELIYCGYWLAMTPLIGWLGRRFRIERGRWVRQFSLHLLFAAVLAISHRLMWLISARPMLPDFQKYTIAELMKSFYAFDYGFGIYWLTLLVIYAVDYYDRFRGEQVRAARLEAQLAQAQLQSLRMQLHPHFLFNTLHTISALVQEDPEAAERMIARLSELLRISLDTVGAEETLLRRELDFLGRYLDIERIRFADRLEVEFQIAPETLDASVPHLILQPLVENALRHGLSRPGRGRISIGSRTEGGELFLSVVDNGRGLPSEDASTIREGVGLGTTRARLECLYGPGQRMELRNAEGGGLQVILKLPFRRAAGPVERPEPVPSPAGLPRNVPVTG